MATSLNPISSSATVPDANTTAAKAESTVAPDKETFLKLLVAQIKNQNPLNPSDGAAFVAQLAQFSQLEQTMAIKQDVQAIRDVIAGSAESGQTGLVSSPGTGEQAKEAN